MATLCHKPPYAANGNTLLAYHARPFVDRAGNKADLVIAEYRDKKGKIHEMVAQVKWK